MECKVENCNLNNEGKNKTKITKNFSLYCFSNKAKRNIRVFSCSSFRHPTLNLLNTNPTHDLESKKH